MTLFTDDDLDLEGAAPIGAGPVVFTDDDLDGGAGTQPLNGIKVPPPPRPKTRPSKKPRQPVATLGQMRDRAAKFVPLQDPASGLDVRWDVEGGGPQLKTPLGDSFEVRGVTLDQAPGKLRPRVAGVRREDGESVESFNRRATAFVEWEKMKARRERAERAQVRAKLTPKMNPEAAFVQSVGEGLGEGLRQGAVGLALATGQDPESMVTLQQPMPRMNDEQARGFWSGTLPQGLGSMVGFGAVGAMTGPVGVAVAGAAQNAGQTYEEARHAGQSHQEALAGAVTGALIGGLEGLGGGGGAAHGLVRGTLGEIGQEVTSQALNNINAKFLAGYDPKRAITEGLWETAAVAGLLGGGAHGLGALGALGAERPSPTAAQQVAARTRANALLQGMTPQEQLMVDQAAADPAPHAFARLSPRQREAALELWHAEADPRLKDAQGRPRPVYHGTQSPTEIDAIDPSRFDPNALYGPGFYTTQDPEVAAGEGGYAETKAPSATAARTPLSDSIKEQMKAAGWQDSHLPTSAQAGIEAIQEAALNGEIDAETEQLLISAINESIGVRPHAYKLYLDVRKPFDADAPADPALVAAVAEEFDNPLTHAMRIDPTGYTNENVYLAIQVESGGKAQANEWLRSKGYDGITHIGGGRWGRGTSRARLSDRTLADQEADRIGATVKEVIPTVSSFNGVGRTTYHVVDPNNRTLSLLMEDGWPKAFDTREEAEAAAKELGPQYDLEGHRVWIAFKPEQVKSVWAGEFDKADPRLAAQRPIQGFRFASDEVLASPKLAAKMTPQQARAALKGVKAEEREWLGLDAVIARAEAEGRPITKAELQEAAAANRLELREDALRYDDKAVHWRTIGQEKVFTTTWGDTYVIRPVGNQWRLEQRDSRGTTQIIGDYPSIAQAMAPVPMLGSTQTQPRYAKYNPFVSLDVVVDNPREVTFYANQGGQNVAEGYESQHFGDKGQGLLAHARVWDGQVDGQRALMLGEVQSDLHQAGRQRGYAKPGESLVEEPDNTARLIELEEIQEERDLTQEELDELYEIQMGIGEPDESTKKVPDAPFKDTWPNLLLKRMVMYAAEKGYGQVVWPEGQAHARLYYKGREAEAPGIYSALYDKKLPQQAREWARRYGARYEFKDGLHRLTLGPQLTEVAAPGGAGLPMFSLTPSRLQAMEQAAREAGRPVALTPDTADAMRREMATLSQQMMQVEPGTPEFEAIANQWTGLARAVEEMPEPGEVESLQGLAGWAGRVSMEQEGAAQELMKVMGVGGAVADSSSGSQGPGGYDLDPGDGKRAPVLGVPREVFEALGWTDGGQTHGGVNVLLEDVDWYARELDLKMPLGEADEAVAQLRTAAALSRAKGLSTVSLRNTSLGGPGSWATAPHETWHAGQEEAARLLGETMMELHRAEFADTNPYVTRMMQTRIGKLIAGDGPLAADNLAMEMAAYVAGGQAEFIGMSTAQGIDYLVDYLDDIVQTRGPAALTRLSEVAWLRPNIAEAIDLVKEQYGRTDSERTIARSEYGTERRAPGRADAAAAGQGAEQRDAQGRGRRVAASLPDGSDAGAGAGGIEGVPPGATDPATGGPSGPDLFRDLLKSENIRSLSARVRDEMRRGGLELDESLPPYMQVVKALLEKPELVRANPAIVQALDETGLTEEKLIGAYREAASEAGAMLRAVQGDAAYIRQLVQSHPELARKGLGEARFQHEALKVLGDTELGMTKWGRATSLTQAMALTRMATMMTNVWAATGQLALDVPVAALTALGQVAANPQAYRQADTDTIVQRARVALGKSIEPSLQVLWSLPPRALTTLTRGRVAQTARNQRIGEVIGRLTQLYPHEMGRLRGLEWANSQTAENVKLFEELGKSFAAHKPQTAQQKEYLRQWRGLATQDRFNKSVAGKALKGVEGLYATLLKPLVWQEIAFREPYFVGALDRALTERGLSIEQLTTTGTVPHETVRDALNAALTATWGYRPELKNPDLGPTEQLAEAAGKVYIDLMNKLGPLNVVVGDLFARSTTNAVKFAWEWGPWGALSPGARITGKIARGERGEISRHEAERIARAMAGTTMYALAWMLTGASEPGDDEWYKVPTGRRDKQGRPLSVDVRPYPQLAFFMGAADLVRRAKDGRLNDVKAAQRLKEIYLGARQRAPEQAALIDEAMKWWAGDAPDERKWLRGQQPLGQLLSMPVTPFQNLTALLSQWDPEQAALRDTEASPLLGPTLAKLPFLNKQLPLRQPFTEPAPQEATGRGAGLGIPGPVTSLLFPGIKVAPGLGFASREFARLGLKPTHFLAPDADPAINRAQYAAYAEVLAEVGRELERSPEYLGASAAEQAATWERLLGGADGLASGAKEAGQAANPAEVELRNVLKGGPGPLQNKASGLAGEVERLRREGKKP